MLPEIEATRFSMNSARTAKKIDGKSYDCLTKADLQHNEYCRTSLMKANILSYSR